MVNDSCQLQPDRSAELGQTLCEGAEMPFFGCWGLYFFIRISPPFSAVEGSASQTVGADSSYPLCCLYSLSHPQGAELF